MKLTDDCGKQSDLETHKGMKGSIGVQGAGGCVPCSRNHAKTMGYSNIAGPAAACLWPQATKTSVCDHLPAKIKLGAKRLEVEAPAEAPIWVPGHPQATPIAALWSLMGQPVGWGAPQRSQRFPCFLWASLAKTPNSANLSVMAIGEIHDQLYTDGAW